MWGRQSLKNLHPIHIRLMERAPSNSETHNWGKSQQWDQCDSCQWTGEENNRVWITQCRQGHKCCINDVFCALWWFVSKRTDANGTFFCEYLSLLTMLVFSPSRDRGEKRSAHYWLHPCVVPFNYTNACWASCQGPFFWKRVIII